MNFDFRQFVAVAENLRTRDDPAFIRCAVSRYYYAVYHSAILIADNPRFALPKRPANQHKGLWLCLANSLDPDIKLLARVGTEMLGERESADYRAKAGFRQDAATRAKRRAEKMLTTIDSLLV